LPGASSETGVRVAQRIRTEVEGTPFHSTEYQVYPLTISIGVASAPKTESNSQVMSRADRCLYQAKQRGRNCVVLDEESVRLASASVVSITNGREVARG
jgi:diguanylate cyclase (GGDEF)-like protein